MAKDDAVPGNVFCEQKLAVGPFDKLHRLEMSGDVSPGSRKNRGLADVAAELKAQTCIRRQTGQAQSANDPAAGKESNPQRQSVQARPQT